VGYLVGNRCYGSAGEATDAYYSTTRPALTPGTTTYESYYSVVSGSWQQCRSQITALGVRSGNVCVPTASLAFKECAPEGYFADGLILGWAVAGVLVVAWGFVKVREALR